MNEDVLTEFEERLIPTSHWDKFYFIFGVIIFSPVLLIKFIVYLIEEYKQPTPPAK